MEDSKEEDEKIQLSNSSLSSSSLSSTTLKDITLKEPDIKDAYVQVGGIIKDSALDGPGINLTVFFSGCSFGCDGCHNPEAQDPKYGTLMTVNEILDNNITSDTTGVTLTGGEPLEQPFACCTMLMEAKKRGLKTILYTGSPYLPDRFLWEYIDYLKIGPFIKDLKTFGHPFVGSSNQRMYRIEGPTTNGGDLRNDFNSEYKFTNITDDYSRSKKNPSDWDRGYRENYASKGIHS
jgi:anaerobic ribonucleoside-triphosphate reductase activating protein